VKRNLLVKKSIFKRMLMMQLFLHLLKAHRKHHPSSHQHWKIYSI